MGNRKKPSTGKAKWSARVVLRRNALGGKVTSDQAVDDTSRDQESSVPSDTDVKDTDGFPIVGVGASAGGLQALQRLLKALPADPGVAIVIIQHLDPTRKSLTPEILAKCTSLTLCEVHDNPQVRANSVYIIPPGKYLTISNGEFQLSEPDEPRGSRMAINVFMRSLAKEARQRSVAIIMSGSGADGALGVKAIKEAGGMVIVQTPKSAEHDSMPRNAIQTGTADYILEPEKMPEMLTRFAEHPYTRIEVESLQGEDELSAVAPLESDDAYAEILSLLRTRTKRDFRHYKDGTLARRIRRRMCLRTIDDPRQYLDYLKETPDEGDALVKDLLISVTDFFRDPEAWADLQQLAISPIVARKSDDDVIRVWMPGCATGEEPYSLKMLFIEALAESKKQTALQIFASDIDAAALALGRAGIYPASIEADVSPERLKRFFEPLSREARYRVSKQLRESVVFGEHNLIGDPPFSKLDMICCRNLLIYLKPECQRKVLSLFHFALYPDGYLFLGSAETLGREHHLFQTLSKRWRIYQRVSTERSGEVDLPVFERGKPRSLVHANRLSGERGEFDLASLAYQKLLDWYAPAAVLINRRWEIQYVVGNVEPYLRHAAGAPTNDLLQKLRRGLRAKVRSSVEHAIAGQQPVVTAARALNGSKSRDVRISAQPILNDASAELVLVLFEEVNPRLRESGTGKRRVDWEEGGPDRETNDNLDSDDQRTISKLEDELAGARIDLKSALDRGDSSDERFRLSNEEVIGANEELQSANEELETSKEELQSLNEELNTVNNQLAAKVEELETKHSDLTNLLAATDVATVCLDADLNIRWFSPATTRIIRLKESDIGRSLADFKHDFVDDSFQKVVGQVLEQKVPVLDEVSCHDGRTYLRRVSRYSTDGDRLAGVVLTFVDITERKEADQALRDSEEKYRSLSESLDQQVRDRTAVMAILRDITEAANEAISVEAALQIALDRILEYNSWVVGHAWVITEDGQELASTRVWSTNPQFETSDLVAFRTTTEAIRIPVGGGFVGHVAQTAEPHWLESTEAFQHWLRENPVRFGLKSAIAFPICIDGNVVAVLEFYSDRQIAREERFTEIMPSVGIQLGHVFERKRLEREVALVADREQRRIGQEMHDGLSQQISGIAMLAGALADNLAAELSTQTERAQRLVAATEEAKQLARGLIKGLLPVEIHPDGLRSGLEELAEQVTSIHGIQCSLESSLEAPAVDSFTATQLYRIAKEAVHNAVKHAKAKSIWIRLGNNKNELLSVEDDGIGLNDDNFHEGEGLRIMRHRAGLFGSTIQIYNNPDGGTVVSCKSRT